MAAATTDVSLVPAKRPTLTEYMADKHHLSGPAFLNAIRATVFKEGSNEQLCAFLMVAEKYDLDPITREIYAFPTKGGGIMPIVSIDGWSKMVNQHPAYDGCEFVDTFDDEKKIVSITCKMFRKDRSRAIQVTEYLSECHRPTEPWNKWPVRMLRWKAFIQCARIAFSFTGIYDPDEASRIEPSLGPVIEAQEYGNVEDESATALNTLLGQLEYTEAQVRKMKAAYVGRVDELIQYLQQQVAKKQQDGSQKKAEQQEAKPAEAKPEVKAEPQPEPKQAAPAQDAPKPQPTRQTPPPAGGMENW